MIGINDVGLCSVMQIWDTAGQERFKSLRTPFYRGADICLLTYAVDDARSLQNLTTWKQEFVNYADVQKVETFPFIVIANKIDIEKSGWQVKKEMGLKWCEENGGYPLVEASAKDSSNVGEAFRQAVKKFQKSGDAYYRPDAPNVVNLRNMMGTDTKKSVCCG